MDRASAADADVESQLWPRFSRGENISPDLIYLGYKPIAVDCSMPSTPLVPPILFVPLDKSQHDLVFAYTKVRLATEITSALLTNSIDATIYSTFCYSMYHRPVIISVKQMISSTMKRKNCLIRAQFRIES